MNEPKVKWSPELAEKYKQRRGFYPAGYKPETPKLSDKEEASLRIQEQSFRGLPVSPGSIYPGSYIARTDSSTTEEYARLLAQKKEQRAVSKEQRDIKKYGVDYKKSLLDLQEKQKKIGEEKTDDITKERSKIFTELSKAEGILNKTIKTKTTDEEGIENDVNKPAYSSQQREQAKRSLNSYTKRLQIIDMVEKFRTKGLQVNISDVENYLKEQEKNIDAITLEMTKKGIPDRVAMVFKNTALQIMMEGNSKQTAMQKAAEQVKTLFPQYFQ